MLLERLVVEVCATGKDVTGREARAARYFAVALLSFFWSRDLYRAAALSWMMPLADILSMSDAVSAICLLTVSSSFAVSGRANRLQRATELGTVLAIRFPADHALAVRLQCGCVTGHVYLPLRTTICRACPPGANPLS